VGYDEAEGFPPLTMEARGLTGGTVEITSPPSSQFLSALLMVAPYAAHDVMLRITGEFLSRPYVEMTIRVMRSLGVEVLTSEEAHRFVVPSTQRYAAREISIEPDASAATYFWAAAAITGGRVRVQNLTRASLQGDVAFVDVLARMGCRIDSGTDYLGVEGPKPGSLRGIDVDLNEMPDTAQTLAVAALFADGPTRIRNVANLRIKETDRLAALESELMRLGAQIELTEDSLTVVPPAHIKPAAIETYDDHRMVMSFTLAGLVADGVVIKDADCVSKSFPGFFDTLATLVSKS
jgi:3-phosphoshikimate 1-carboxyvinyltransferase